MHADPIPLATIGVILILRKVRYGIVSPKAGFVTDQNVARRSAI
jgi:hypothetical protein